MDPSTRLEILDTADIPDSNDKVVSGVFLENTHLNVADLGCLWAEYRSAEIDRGLKKGHSPIR